MNLSERLRPGVEAAPWVIDEVKALESKLRDFTANRADIEDLLNGLANDAHMLAHGRDMVTGDVLKISHYQGIGLGVRDRIYRVWSLVRGTPAVSSLEMSAVSSTVGLAQMLANSPAHVRTQMAEILKTMGEAMFERGFDHPEGAENIGDEAIHAALKESGTASRLYKMFAEPVPVYDRMRDYCYGMFCYGKSRRDSRTGT